MTLAQSVVFIFGIFTLIGGVIGFVKAKSNASLIAGSISGIALLICANGIGKGSTSAYILAALISLILGVRFFKTWTVKRKLMPDLLMVIFSSISLMVVILEVVR